MASTELFANCLPDASKIDEYLLIPAGLQDPTIAEWYDALSTRGQLTHAWRLAKKSYDESEKTRTDDPAGAPANTIPSGKRVQIFPESQERYNHKLAL